jgi:hypothetical protein
VADPGMCLSRLRDGRPHVVGIGQAEPFVEALPHRANGR